MQTGRKTVHPEQGMWKFLHTRGKEVPLHKFHKWLLETAQLANNFKLRNKRKKQHLLSSYYHFRNLSSLPCWWCWKLPVLTTPLEDLVFNSNLTIPNPENRRVQRICFTTIYKQGLFATQPASPAHREHWPEIAYFHISPVVHLSDDRLREFWWFEVVHPSAGFLPWGI